MEEAIDLATSEDDEPAEDARGLCINCGQVSKPHVCPHGAKIMKRMSRAECGMSKAQKTSASGKNDPYKHLFGDSDDDEPAPPKPSMPKAAAAAACDGAPAYDVLNTLLKEHSSLQTQCTTNKATIEKQKKDLTAVKKRETAANAAVKQAATEVTRLQTEVTRLQTERDQTIAQLQQTPAPAPAAPAPASKSKGKGKMSAVAAAAAAAAAGLAPGKDAYSDMIVDAAAAYTTKADACKKKNLPAPPPAPAPAPAAPAPLPNRVQILQKNNNPQYNTEREVCFMDIVAARVTAGLPSGTATGWFYDNSTPPTPWNPAWVSISDATLIGYLETLGKASKDSAGMTLSFIPTVGSHTSYPIGQHNYTVTVVNAPAPQAPAPPPAPPPPPPAPWQHDMLFSGTFFKMDNKYLDAMLQQYHFDEPDVVIPKSGQIAALAEQWSSYAQGFEYDPNKCEMWVKPNWLHMWLRTARERKYNEARILMHGMRSQNYHLLAKDLSGFDFNFSNHGAKRWGFYAACSDHIASDYNAQGGGPLPDGTGVIGLLLIKRGAGLGAYEHYHLDSHRGGPQSHSVNNAYAVRDQMLWLPLGLAYAKPP